MRAALVVCVVALGLALAWLSTMPAPAPASRAQQLRDCGTEFTTAQCERLVPRREGR